MNKQRRHFTPEFKLEVVLEGLRGEKSIAQLCRERDITDALYYSWRDQFLERAPSIFAESGQQERSNAEQAARMADLERMVGKLALENDVLKKAKSWLGAQRTRNGR
jgi:transposase-like protein